MVVFGESGGISSKSDCIRGKVVVFGEKWLYLDKMVLFGQSGCNLAKVVVFGQSGCISSKSCCILA